MSACREVLPILCVSLVLGSCGRTSETSASPPTGETQPASLWMVVDRGDKTPGQIARELELAPEKTYEDYIDLGTSYLWMREYYKAAEAYEMAARQSRTTEELVGALYTKASALAYVDLPEALRTADLMARLAPDNLEVAWLRYGLYLHSSDQLGVVLAGDHLLSLDPSLSGKEVLGFVEAVLIGHIVTVLVAGIAVVSVTALTPPEDRAAVVAPIMEAFARTVRYSSGLLKVSETTFGRLLVEQLGSRPGK